MQSPATKLTTTNAGICDQIDDHECSHVRPPPEEDEPFDPRNPDEKLPPEYERQFQNFKIGKRRRLKQYKMNYLLAH
jgi:hypothetical protein